MALGNTTPHLFNLYAVGADAMKNMFDVFITPPAGLLASTKDNIQLRVKGFKVPEYSNEMYEVGYKTVKIKRPKSLVTIDRTFELAFRLDANYEVYKTLGQWANRITSAGWGFVATDLNESNTGTVQVFALNTPITYTDGMDMTTGVGGVNIGDFASKEAWQFQYCWPSKIALGEFAMETSEPQEVTVTFQFLDMTDPIQGAKE
jgi:hypothetical protein